MIIPVDLQALNLLEVKALQLKGGQSYPKNAPKFLQIMKRTVAIIHGTNDKNLVTVMNISLDNEVVSYKINYKIDGIDYYFIGKNKGLVTSMQVYRFINKLDKVAHNIFNNYQYDDVQENKVDNRLA